MALDPTSTEQVDTTTTTTEDDEAGFAEGFAGTESPTETPGKTKAESETNEEAPGTGDTAGAAAPAPAQPEFVQLTRQEYEVFKSAADLVSQIKSTADKSFGTAFGKIGGIERDLQAFKQGKKVTIDAKLIESLRKDELPELADALEQINGLQALPVEIDAERLKPLVQEQVAPVLSQVQQRDLRRLARMHPDYAEVDKKPEFRAWIDKQGDDFRRELAEASKDYDADFVGAALTRFKKETASAPKPENAPSPPAPSRQSRMRAAVTPGGTGSANNAPSAEDEFNEGFRTG